MLLNSKGRLTSPKKLFTPGDLKINRGSEPYN